MNWKREGTALALVLLVFLGCFYLPVELLFGKEAPDTAIAEALYLVRWYAREHVVFCLIPAFFIAGAISVFVGQASVMRYLGATAPKVLAYGVASVSGTILAVCSCTVLPLFAGIYRMGAGLGPASTFLYAGPAINVLAIVLTARVLGPGLGIARAVGAIVFSILIGLSMHLLFRGEDRGDIEAARLPQDDAPTRSLGQNAIFFGVQVALLVFANWGKPQEEVGIWWAIYDHKWWLTGISALCLAIVLTKWFGISRRKIGLATSVTVGVAILLPETPMLAFGIGVIGLSWFTSTTRGEPATWFDSSWTFAKQILPLLLAGVFVAGLLLGRPGHEALVPDRWIVDSVGGNGLGAILFASVAGTFMYFATLTEIPILQGLLGGGMGQGPALALLLAGPALSLPNMIVIRSVIGTRKTLAFVLLVIVMSTVTGLIYGALA